MTTVSLHWYRIEVRVIDPIMTAGEVLDMLRFSGLVRNIEFDYDQSRSGRQWTLQYDFLTRRPEDVEDRWGSFGAAVVGVKAL